MELPRVEVNVPLVARDARGYDHLGAAREETLLGTNGKGLVVGTDPDCSTSLRDLTSGVAVSRARLTAFAFEVLGRAGGEKKTGRCHRSGNLGVVVGEVRAGGVGLACLSTIPRGHHIVPRLKKVVSLRQARPIREKITALLGHQTGYQ